MEAAVEKLEAMKAESDVNYISRKLDHEFASSEDGEQLNPNKMLQKLGDIKKEYGSLLKEADEIRKAQKEATEFFKNQLTTICQAVQSLESQSQLEPEQKAAELSRLEEIFGTQLREVTSVESGEGQVNSDTVTLSVVVEDNTSPAAEAAWEAELSPAEKRRNSGEFMEVTDEEFMSVSSLVRGRVKLGDVNTTYRAIWTHFKEESGEELTSSDMYKMGLRVTGQTGEAKLKVLRALKLLQISKSGSVKLS